MKTQRDLAAWVSRKGDFRLPLPSPQVKGFLITDGASVSVDCDEGGILVASGRGFFSLDYVVNFRGELVVDADKPNCRTSVHLVGWGPAEQVAGFLGTESFVQLDAKSRNTVPPEIQAMFDLMQRNSLRREAVLRAELEKARGAQ